MVRVHYTSARAALSAGLGVTPILLLALAVFAGQGVEQGRVNQKASGQNSGENQETASGPPVALAEGERINPSHVMIAMGSKLIEEGPAVKKIAENEANINNVRYNIDSFLVGYAIADDKLEGRAVFTGPTKGWRATAIGEVSRWPPVLYRVARKETMRQAKLIDAVPVSEPRDELNNLRLYYRPLVVGHDGDKYREEPTVLAFFIHPDTGTRMTLAFRGDQTYSAIGEALSVTAKVYVKEVVPGRSQEGSRLVPSIFYSKETTIEAERFTDEGASQALKAVIEAHDHGPLATDVVQSLFTLMARHTGGDTRPVSKGPQ
jgi:hypothetical protein